MRASGTDAGCGHFSAFGDDGIETVGIIKAFQVFAANMFGLAVVAGRKRWNIPLPVEKRLVNSKPLSVWTHLTYTPLRAKAAAILRRKSADE